MLKPPTRRDFLSAAPLAAASLALTGRPIDAQTPPPLPFKLLSAQQLAADLPSLHQKPGSVSLFEVPGNPLTAVLTVEQDRVAPEFEWHEGRDHIVQVLEGSTTYELGGTPQSRHTTRPGEWLAPASTGATSLTLHAGDWLIIPRGTLHKRTTSGSVTFYLISTTGK